MIVFAVLLTVLCFIAIYRVHRPRPITGAWRRTPREPVDFGEALKPCGGWRATLPYGQNRLPD